MNAFDRIVKVVDWFIPYSDRAKRSQLTLSRNFVFTHLFGPAMSQSISVFLYNADPHPGWPCWIVIAGVCLFWVLPFHYRHTGNLQRSALMSVELLAFVSLFGSFFYGGVSSPFLPWFIVSLLLGFFYLSDRASVLIALFSFNILGFCAGYCVFGFPQLVSASALTPVGWISILSATVYMSWMAIFYANVISVQTDLEREGERHRQTADHLRQARDKAQAANRAKSIFLAKMSHELRTPLNAVIGFSEILLESVRDEGKDERKIIDLERINAAGKHLLSLVTGVLDLSKIEARDIELKIETFNLDLLVDEVVATGQPLMRANNNKLVVRSTRQLGLMSTDQTKIRQVILNLLGNAAKFTENGTVTLTIQREMRQAADWVIIQVLDTGIGIASADMPRLFGNFQQASNATSRKYGGTGLGLALSQKLCNLMGGGITVASEPGSGSCFTVHVPARVVGSDEVIDEPANAGLALAR
jgi:signal transduction histidine kinase